MSTPANSSWLKEWMLMHNSFISEGKQQQPEVVLLGDSLIANMCLSPLWQQMFEPLNCLNLGIGGDTTENVLWRIQNGEFDNIQPKVIAILVGTNNVDDSADRVVEGILDIVRALRVKQPSSHIIVMGLIPKGEKPNPYREKNSEVNQKLTVELVGIPLTHFLRIDDKEFMSSEGVISRSIMYDFLHLTRLDGYKILCEPLLKEVKNILDSFS